MSCGRFLANPRACPPSSPNVSWPREPTVGSTPTSPGCAIRPGPRFGSENGQSGEERAYDAQFRARRVAEDLALALQASLLVRHAPAAVADAFCVTRLGREGGHAYGTLPPGVAAQAIIERALPS